LISITIFPIPIDKRYIAEAAIPAKNNFIPLYSLYESVKYLKSFKMMFLVPLIGNIFLFMPFGFFLRMKTPVIKIKKVLLYGILASLSVEILQLFISLAVRLFYRSIDVDDLLYNTLGTISGFYISDFIISVIKRHKNESILARSILSFFNS